MEHIKITRIQAFKSSEDSNTLGYAHITLDDAFVVRNLRLVKGRKGLFLGMPSYRTRSGSYSDIFFPVSREARQILTEAVFEAFREQHPELVEGQVVYEVEDEPREVFASMR